MILRTEQLCAHGRFQYPDFSLCAGEMRFLTGPSGSGKSSLMRLLNGTIPKSAGKVYLHGLDTDDLSMVTLRRQVLYVRQEPVLFPGSIWDTITRFPAYLGEAVPEESTVLAQLAQLSLQKALHEEVSLLSGGEKQRLFLCIALMRKADVFLLDEPTAALDAALATQTMKLLQEKAKAEGKSFLIISHDATLVERFSEGTIVLRADERGEDDNA